MGGRRYAFADSADELRFGTHVFRSLSESAVHHREQQGQDADGHHEHGDTVHADIGDFRMEDNADQRRRSDGSDVSESPEQT